MRLLPAIAQAALASTASSEPPLLSFGVDEHSGEYAVSVDGVAWYTSAPPMACIAGARMPLIFQSMAATQHGSDKFGTWTGKVAVFAAEKSATIEVTFKQYASRPNLAVATARFPSGVDTRGCGANTNLSTTFPAFRTAAARAQALHTLSWRGQVLSKTAAAKGLGALGASGLDCGPVASTDSATGRTLVWSSLDSHKILPQRTANGVWAMGLSGSIPRIPAGFSYSTMFTVAEHAGATAGVYAWGALIQRFHDTTRLPSVTLSDIGYYTDDGAYYYVWEAFGIPPREAPAESLLVSVKEDLHRRGVPIAYMQLDDCTPNEIEPLPPALHMCCCRRPVVRSHPITPRVVPRPVLQLPARRD